MSTKKTQPKETLSLPWKNLGDYITKKRLERNLSQRELGKALGINHSHLSRIVNGLMTPYPETCKKIAEYFGDPISSTLRLAGWIDNDDIGYDEVNRQFISLIRDDPEFRALFNVYMEQETTAQKHNFVRWILTTWEMVAKK